ncbi:LOW QUALITY PROTEIN: uncharacterized protein LOC108103814 [Drosophila eugracilis]|uniref:LOW QUALITY PROTEIN: uncharacterized protein LOC108103814 n=1 Tax=Drosophila eugracilis TaxID=29029 RepID=UPI001BD983C4|nr:LOW QUALITY PROTEIN: uncharacterized protein LOC108103814 [Drosophila eugracilis]
MSSPSQIIVQDLYRRQVEFQIGDSLVNTKDSSQNAHLCQSHLEVKIGDGINSSQKDHHPIKVLAEDASKPKISRASETYSTHRYIPLKKDEDENDDFRQLQKVFQELDMSDQIILYRAYHLLPAACSTLWRTTQKRLDFRTFHKKLGVEAQNHLLVQMIDHFKYVYFVADKLQENLNTLERAGIKSLSSVQRCELLLMDENSRLEGRTTNRPFEGDCAGVKGIAQWPLHALPKLIRNVRRLKAHCEIQVHFIEHFQHLELLVLYGSITQTALTGILEHCQKLSRLFLKFENDALSLKSIDQCSKLKDLSLSTGLFASQKDLVMKLTDLRLLELTHCEKDSQLTLECLKCVLGQRPEAVEQVQIDCCCFQDPNWIKEVGLNRCNQIRGFVLANCIFGDREISQLSFPKVHKYIALTSCHDVKEYQVLDMVRQCPGLNEIYLIDCPQLSWKVLQGIYRIRKSENLSYPITVILSQCKKLKEVYQSTYSVYWCFKLSYIKIERLKKQCRPVKDIQVFFNDSQ